MSPAEIEPKLPESSSTTVSPEPEPVVSKNRRFGELRGVQWRIDLGILPASSSSIDDLRRVTADCRRRYAALRRQLLVDPHIPKDGSNFPDHVVDNPLSQNPDSIWGRFFQKAELEKMVDQDLSRLYPENGSYFQTPGCQGILRRILLLWCIRHPHYGYRQGMHELLAPLLYVLQVDIERLSEVRKLYEDHFTDNFDGFSFHENDLTHKFGFNKFSESNEIAPQKNPARAGGRRELDPKIHDIVLLSDAYGAEGELGIVLSEKFMEHDAYCMFDALLNGAGGAVAMAEFFSPSPLGAPQTGLPPVIEASSELYHLLSIVDSSLYSHFIELEVEPQYFALRWLRVLFGREFTLEDLLVVWDEIFAYDNTKLHRVFENDDGVGFGILNSYRGAFIAALAVSLILNLRSSLLATETATSCLQRLLNFPEMDLQKLLAKAKSLLPLAMDANMSNPLPIHVDRTKPVMAKGHSLSLDSTSPGSPLKLVPDSYWEEKWRVLHKEQEQKQGTVQGKVPGRIKSWSERVKVRLSRTESEPTPPKPKLSVRRNLLEDLSRQLGLDEDTEKVGVEEDLVQKNQAEVSQQNDNGNGGSEDSSSIFSDPPSPSGVPNDHGNDTERSSVASNQLVDEIENENENNLERTNTESSCNEDPEASPLPVSDHPEGVTFSSGQMEDSTGRPGTISKEQKHLLGKLQWLFKFGRNGGEGASEKEVPFEPEATKTSLVGRNQSSSVGCLTSDSVKKGETISDDSVKKGENLEQNMMVTLKNLGQTMLENIQVIESVFQQDNKGQLGSNENVSKSPLIDRGQFAAVEALKELRKISNLLSEM